MSHDPPPVKKSRPLHVEVLTMEVLNAQIRAQHAKANKHFLLRVIDRRWGGVAAGVLFTLTLHLLVFSALLLGTSGRPLKPIAIEGASASQSPSKASNVVTALILMDEHGITPDEPDPIPEVLDDPTPQSDHPLKLVGVSVPTPPEPSGSEEGRDEHAPTADAAGDETGRALMFGRYMGQIKARIERAWTYPVAANTASFNCKVQIKQNRQGVVLEVMLVKCAEDSAWQKSLVQAIERASPLSSPPVESVFTETVTLSFDAAGIPQLAQAVSDAGFQGTRSSTP